MTRPRPTGDPRATETPQQLAARLTADQIVALLTRLQGNALRRQARPEATVLAAIILWLNTTGALAEAADRRLRADGLSGVPGEALELVARLRRAIR
jgi:hypothetical protein